MSIRQILTLFLVIFISYQSGANSLKLPVGNDTLKNGILDYIGIGFHNPSFSNGNPIGGSVTGSTDLHFGLQYMRYIRPDIYLFIRLNASRYQNKLDFSKTEINSFEVGDSLVRTSTISDYNYSNDYLMADVSIGAGYLISISQKWTIDLSAAIGYRAHASIDAHKVSSEGEVVEFNKSSIADINGNFHVITDAGFRWYSDPDSYFTFGFSSQLNRSLSFVDSNATMTFSAIIFKLGYGFNF